MSCTFIYKFQNKLYMLLADNAEIKGMVKKIYIGAVQDGKEPFLLITILSAKNLSRYKDAIYEVDFQISAYAKDHNHHLLTKLADQVLLALPEAKRASEGYSVSGIKVNNIQFEKARNLVLNKLTINCKALIKQEVYI